MNSWGSWSHHSSILVAFRLREAHDLVAPYVTGDEGEASPYTFLLNDRDFDDAVEGRGGLIEHVESRHVAVDDALR